VHVRGKAVNAVPSGMLCDQIRKELHAFDAAIPLVQLAPFTATVDANPELWSVRFVAVLFGAFGAIALFLAIIGVYGVEAFMVARRTREFGVRLALGASPQQVCGLVVRQGLARIAVGLSAGLLLALVAGRILASMLLRVSPHDPRVLLTAALSLAITALLASWLPARRAARIDPIAGLRAE
jgi:putative ABC transport system permease protein